MNKIWAVYFSATGTTKKIVEHIARVMSGCLNAQFETYDFSLPRARDQFPSFDSRDAVVFGSPVYAGRVPNVLLKQLIHARSDGAPVVPVVLFGNRDFDDALIELRDILLNNGFIPFAAGAFAGEHAFSTILGKGRPDNADMKKAESFAQEAAQKLKRARDSSELSLVAVDGTPQPYRAYYQPRDRNGNPIDIRKVKPLTNQKCNDCGICADICAMGSIDPKNAHDVNGICIKCCACVKRCPQGAKYFADENFLFHQRELEQQYTRRAEPRCFISA